MVWYQISRGIALFAAGSIGAHFFSNTAESYDGERRKIWQLPQQLLIIPHANCAEERRRREQPTSQDDRGGNETFSPSYPTRTRVDSLSIKGPKGVFGLAFDVKLVSGLDWAGNGILEKVAERTSGGTNSGGDWDWDVLCKMLFQRQKRRKSFAVMERCFLSFSFLLHLHRAWRLHVKVD